MQPPQIVYVLRIRSNINPDFEVHSVYPSLFAANQGVNAHKKLFKGKPYCQLTPYVIHYEYDVRSAIFVN